MIGRSPDIEGTRSVTEIHCGIVVGNKEENNMTDNYNDDYREVIPEEEKTETDVSETQDNEKNNGNTQVADTAKENSTEKKSEDKKDSSEYEDVCFICRRPESKAGRMFKLPNHICICDDCMHKTMETVSQFDYQGMLNNPNDFNQFNGQNGFPNISFVNLADLQGDGGIPNKQKLKKKKKAEGPKPVFNIKDIPAPHKIKASLDEYVVGQEKAKKVISVAVYNHYKRVVTDTMDEIEIEKSNILMIGPTGSGKTYLVKTLAKLLDVPLAIADATSLTEAGYIGDDIESVVSKLLAAAGNDVEKAEKGIIFIDEIDKIASSSQNRTSDISREGVQRDLLPIVEGSAVNTKYGMVRTDHILFIAAGAFHFSKPSDMIPELQGRFPLRVELNALGREEFLRILTEPHNALTRQYAALLGTEQIRLQFSEDGIEEIAAFAEEINATSENIGARRLYTIMEKILADISFDAPDMPGAQIVVNRAYVQEHLRDVREDQDLSQYIL